MKHYQLLVWLTQLGLSVALPLAGFVMLGVWLHTAKGWGAWTVIAGLALGLICAVRGFLDSLHIMEQMSRDKKDPQPPPKSFNQHH
jgi:Na+/proline symporter